MRPESNSRRRSAQGPEKTAKQPQSGHEAARFTGKVKIAFTTYSCSIGRVSALRKNRPKRNKDMTLVNLMRRLFAAMREMIAPSYKPERHYMRGPGPATSRRMGNRT
jgi:hypothetical protein